MEIAGINIVVKDYLKKNKIRLGEAAKELGMSQSNFSERLISSRALTLDEFMILYKMCGSSFAGEIMAYYKMPLMLHKEMKELISICTESKHLLLRASDIIDVFKKVLHEIEIDC